MSRTAPMIGSYKKSKPSTDEDVRATSEPEIVHRQPKVENAATALSTGIQEDLQESIDKSKDTVQKAKTYEQILSERGITREKAHAVIDAMLEKGYWEETIPLKLPTSVPITVTFRTRAQSDYMRYLRALEIYNPKFVEEQQEIQIRYFLAASLVAFKGKNLNTDADVEKNFEAKLHWLENQAERIVSLLGTQLSIFDLQIQAIMSEGSVENF